MHWKNIGYFGSRAPVEKILKFDKVASCNLEDTVVQVIMMSAICHL
jgi:hypothetical protein